MSWEKDFVEIIEIAYLKKIRSTFLFNNFFVILKVV